MPLIKIKDTISPDLKRRARAAGNKQPLLLAMGTAVKGLGQQAFSDPTARAQAWAPRKDNHPHPLLLGSAIPKNAGGGSSDPVLAHSLVVDAGSDKVVIRSDRPYAAIHQLGGEHIPARPFLPFYKSGQITELGRRRVENALKAALRVRGL